MGPQVGVTLGGLRAWMVQRAWVGLVLRWIQASPAASGPWPPTLQNGTVGSFTPETIPECSLQGPGAMETDAEALGIPWALV